MVYLQRCLVVTWLVPRETAACSARSLYIIQPCTMSRHFMQSHIRRVLGCLAVTCRLHFWQNGRDLLRATAVIQGRNGNRNKSQHRKFTLEKTIIRPFLPVVCREAGGRWGQRESCNVSVLTPPPPTPHPLRFLSVVLNGVVSKRYNRSLSLLICLEL